MPRIEPMPKKRMTWLVRLILWAQKLKYGAPLVPALYWARAPKILYGIQVLYRCLDRRHSPLDSSLRVLVSNFIAQINHCAFCSDLSASSLAKKGISTEKVGALLGFRESDLFTAREKAALAYAEAVTHTDKSVMDADVQDLKSNGFSEDDIVELTGWICFQNFSSLFNAALDIPPQGFCRVSQSKPE